jgi:hypothetical protein
MKIRWRCLILIALLLSAGCLRKQVREEEPQINPYDEKTELQLLEERLGV